MHNLPRLIIAIPIAILVLVVYIKMAFPNQLQSFTSLQSASQSEDLITTDTSEYSRQETIPIPQESDPVSFDIVEPRACEYENEELIAKVFIQNSKVSATITQEEGVRRIILVNDCVHIWQEGEFTGQQICGVNQYLELFQTYSSFLSPDMIAGMIPGIDGAGASGGVDILSSVLNSCVDGAVDEVEFVLPSNITFEEGSVEESYVQ